MVDWFNHRRPFEYCDDLTPVEANKRTTVITRPQRPPALKLESLRHAGAVHLADAPLGLNNFARTGRTCRWTFNNSSRHRSALQPEPTDQSMHRLDPAETCRVDLAADLETDLAGVEHRLRPRTQCLARVCRAATLRRRRATFRRL